MAATKPTYILAPNWDFLPDGPIFLGSIIIDPRNPARSLNKKNAIAVESNNTTTSLKTDWSISREKLLSGRVGIWASFLASIIGAGADSAIHGTRDKDELYECKALETTYFQPDEPYISKSLRNPVVKAYTEKFWHKYIYIVTGVKVAKGATVTTVDGLGLGAELKAGLDATSVGVPVGGGPEVKGEMRKKMTVRFGGSDDFILGYQLIRIKPKKDGSFVEEDYNKWALLHDDGPDAVEKDARALKEMWEITGVDSPGDDLHGLDMSFVPEENCNVITIAGSAG